MNFVTELSLVGPASFGVSVSSLLALHSCLSGPPLSRGRVNLRPLDLKYSLIRSPRSSPVFNHGVSIAALPDIWSDRMGFLSTTVLSTRELFYQKPQLGLRLGVGVGLL